MDDKTILLVSMRKGYAGEVCPAEVGYLNYYKEFNNIEYIDTNLKYLLLFCQDTEYLNSIEFIVLGSVIPTLSNTLDKEIAKNYNLDTPNDYNRNFQNINRIARIIKIFKRFCTSIFV